MANQEKLEAAVYQLLEALGEDCQGDCQGSEARRRQLR